MLNSEIKDAVPLVVYAAEHMETMGDRIKQLRQARRLTQPELAKLVGVTKSAVSQWEDGSTRNIKLQTFLNLCDVLKTDAEYLIFGPARESPSHGPAGNGPSSTVARPRVEWRKR